MPAPATTSRDLFRPDGLLTPISVDSDWPVNQALRLVLERLHRTRRIGLVGVTLIFAALVLIAGVIVWLWGYRTQRENPGFWQVSLVGLLFWLSVSQGMIAVGAVLRLFHASWRYPLGRLLDMGSLFGLWVPALLPFLIVARDRIYALGSSDWSDNVWRVSGPMFYDALAIGIAYAAGWLLLYLTAVPDFALLASLAEPGSRRQRFYRRLGGSWIGARRQWQTLRRAEGVVVVGALGAFVASQTILGWDFQLASARDWDSSIFAPLYTLGSLVAALAMIVLVGTVSDRFLTGGKLLEPRHYDYLGRAMLAIGLIWFYFRWCDYLTAWYEKIPAEWQIQGNRVTAFPILAAVMVAGCFVIPVFGNMPRAVRRSRIGSVLISLCVLTGVAVQRYLDTVPTFAPNYPVADLMPTVGSVFVFVGLAAMFVLTYLIAARYIPVISWWGSAKEETRRVERSFGRARVTVMAEDPPVWET